MKYGMRNELKKFVNIIREFDYVQFNKYYLFVIIFIFELLFIFQGIDVTDSGYCLVNQVSAYSFLSD